MAAGTDKEQAKQDYRKLDGAGGINDIAFGILSEANECNDQQEQDTWSEKNTQNYANSTKKLNDTDQKTKKERSKI